MLPTIKDRITVDDLKDLPSYPQKLDVVQSVVDWMILNAESIQALLHSEVYEQVMNTEMVPDGEYEVTYLKAEKLRSKLAYLQSVLKTLKYELDINIVDPATLRADEVPF